MLRLLLIARDIRAQAGLQAELARLGLACSVTPYHGRVTDEIIRQAPDIILVEMAGNPPDTETPGLIKKMKQTSAVPVIALVPGETLDSLDGQLNADDFLTSPYDARELALRAKRLWHSSAVKDTGEVIRCEGLMIDLATCEVTVEGMPVELTFKEYELLKLLASNRGRVYTREALLDKIWGYDYFGGDRTVDVHVRRLRSKIEDPAHSFIETVRNIGYRSRKDV